MTCTYDQVVEGAFCRRNGNKKVYTILGTLMGPLGDQVVEYQVPEGWHIKTTLTKFMAEFTVCDSAMMDDLVQQLKYGISSHNIRDLLIGEIETLRETGKAMKRTIEAQGNQIKKLKSSMRG